MDLIQTFLHLQVKVTVVKFIVLAAFLFATPAFAFDCNAPGHGDDPAKVEAFIKVAEAPPPPIMKHTDALLIKVCEAKYNHIDREVFAAQPFMISDKDFDAHGVLEITGHMFHILELLEHESAPAEPEPPKMDRT